jgi:hypothetical protein
MGNFIIISKELHNGKFWVRPKNLKFAEKITLIPIFLTELGRAVNAFPLVFVKHGENFIFSALLGLAPGKNLFLTEDGGWLGNYIPALIRAYPFGLVRVNDDQLALAIDEDYISEKEGVSFFEDEKLSKETEDIFRFLIEIERGRVLTVNATNKLSELDLIEPWNLRIKTESGEKIVEGIFKINENKLNSLSDDDFISLRQIGALPLIYGQLFSMANLQFLAKFAQTKYSPSKRKKQPEKKKVATLIDDIDVEELFKNLKFPES